MTKYKSSFQEIWLNKGPYIKYLGGGLVDFCGGHEIF